MPTELRRESADLRDKAELEDVRTGAALRTLEDDEYALAGEADPKVFLTTSRNPSTRLTAFAKELKLVFPNAVRVNRGGLVRGKLPAFAVGVVLTSAPRDTQVVSNMVESCRANGFTDIVVVHEHRGEPDGLVVCHLPFGAPRSHPRAFAQPSHRASSSRPLPGPTAYFGLMNCVARHDIKEAGLGTVSEAFPHLIFEARAVPQARQAAVSRVSPSCISSLCRASPRRWASG